MSKLRYLRARLADLRRSRRMVRWGIALSALLLTFLIALAATFAIDWFFDMTRFQRIIALLLGVAGLYWACRQFALPWLQIQETDIDMALLVERQHKLDGDLVAALQFEGPEAEAWGSAQLRHAVIDHVAELGKGLNVLEGFSVRGLVQRGAVLAGALLVAGLFSYSHAAYVRAYLNRICLGAARYPTRTVLDQILVNGEAVDPSASGVVVRSPAGMPVNLSVLASGEMPEAGKVVVQPIAGRGISTLKLDREGEPLTPDPSPQRGEGRYGAQLPELVDALAFELFLGDARTDPIRIEVIPLPVIETQAVVTVPEYAQYAASALSAGQNSRQLMVFEGSRIDLKVVCGNKRLTEANLTIDGVAYPLTAVKGDGPPGRLWALADQESPLGSVTGPLRYEVQVTDEDGLHLPQPLQGSIRIKPDQRPQLAGGALARFVLPSVRPPVYYRATDDFGIARLLAHLEVVRKDGQTEPRRTVTMQELPKPLLLAQLPFKGKFPLDLPSLRLGKGDRVSVTLEAIDYRGPASGQSALSEPIVFEVTDEAGILEDLAKPDYQSAEELDAILRLQLNIGADK